MLTREQILQKKGYKIQVVNIPEWEGDVYVRGLTAGERDQFEESNLIRDKDKKRGLTTYDVRVADTRARLVVMAVCDEKGNRLFTDDDIEAVSSLSSAAVSKLYSVAAALSGITDDDLEDLLKN